MSTSKTVSLESLIKSLVAAGWHDDWLLREPIPRGDGQAVRSPLVLRIGLYPVALIEPTGGVDGEVRGEPPTLLKKKSLLHILWNGEAATSADGREKWTDLPSPKQLWAYLGRSWTESDPRLLPPMVKGNITIGLGASVALGCVLDAQVEGEKRVRVTVPLGSGPVSVAMEACWRLLKTGKYHHALVVVDRSDVAQQLLYRLLPQSDLGVVRLGGARDPSVPVASAPIEICTIGYLAARGWEHLLEMEKGRYDLLVVPFLKKQASMDRLLEYFPGAGLVGVHGSHETDLPDAYGRLVYEHSLEDALSGAEWQPPPGRRTLWLGEIAKIVHGMGTRRSEVEEKVSCVLLRSSSIPSDGRYSLDLDAQELVAESWARKMRLQAGDIIIPALLRSWRMGLRVAVVPEIGDRLVVGHDLIIIRVTDPQVDRNELLEHLKSSLVITYLQDNSESFAGYARITIRSLRRMPVFVPLGEDEPTEQAPANRFAGALAALRNEVIPVLEALGETDGPASDEVGRVGARLRRVLLEIEPPRLDDIVLDEFPTPIALAWRRYRDARFNPYEQVLRLKDVFEAAAFFVYNVMLADHLRNLDPSRYVVADSSARSAWRGASMAARMDFVGSLLNTATTHMSSDLFISRLAGTTVVESVKDLQEQFRNKVSHSATASEGYQYSLIEQYEPKVRTLLQDLLCLADVRLVRVPMFFRRRGKMMRRMEIYRGVVPEVAEEQVTSESLGAAVEYDHLVLLDGEDRTLDLFPMYQLVENEATRYERHLCFMKAAKDKTRTIRGEDAHTSIELDLVGYEDLVSMQEALKTKAAR